MNHITTIVSAIGFVGLAILFGYSLPFLDSFIRGFGINLFDGGLEYLVFLVTAIGFWIHLFRKSKLSGYWPFWYLFPALLVGLYGGSVVL
ncbi:MAG: hypothetical protein WBD51_11080, partial [Burkholderiaceae bacterium]